MTPNPSWPEITLRLVLTLLAGGLIGINREEHGRSAGLRTTMLVCLAASLSMIQANLLLDMEGKSPSSFVVMDLMRLPLGILSGIGFIGAGAILRKDSIATGVTTAATLWFATMLGLCLGGGQLALGITALVLALGILWGLKALESQLHKAVSGTLTIVTDENTLQEEDISTQVALEGGRISKWIAASSSTQAHIQEQTCNIKWERQKEAPILPPFLKTLAALPGVIRVDWKTAG